MPIALAICLSIVAVSACALVGPSGPELPVFRFSEAMQYNKLLLLRRVAPGGNLLLKVLDEDAVLMYDIDKKTVTKVGIDTWRSSTGQASICEGTAGTSDSNETSFKTYAKYALAYIKSPSGSNIAIYSAPGPKIPGINIIPGLGAGVSYGRGRYIEIKSNDEEMKSRIDPVSVRETLPTGLCWSNDEQLVVHYDFYNFSFSVLQLPPEMKRPETPVSPDQSRSSLPDLARLTGVMRDHGVDENGDGLYEKIAVDVETQTTTPRTYQLRVDIRSKSGNYYSEYEEVQLSGGKEFTRFFFDAAKIYDAGDKGEFTYALLNLSYRNSIILDQRVDSAKTSSYELSQFQRPNIIYTGENKVLPVDADPDGKYRALEVLVGVDVLHPGDYEFQGDLYHEWSDVTGEGLIDFGKPGVASLKKGKGSIKLVFSGAKIAKYDRAGKFNVRFVNVHKRGGSGKLVDTLLTTRHFEPTEFSSR